MKKLQLEIMQLGMIATNCYLLKNKETGRMVIVDPADEAERVIRRIDHMGGTPEAILLTHGHFDHIGAADALRFHYDIPVCAMLEEQAVLEDPSKNLSGRYGAGYIVKADRFFRDGECDEFAGFSVQVFHTPGHTIGSGCYYLPEEAVLFSGDTLFQGTVGRTDLPTGSMRQIRASLGEKLLVLPDEVLVYPGHGEMTDIAFEKQYNPYQER